jgi:predicted anti-sigma-YlaC factor YlaD
MSNTDTMYVAVPVSSKSRFHDDENCRYLDGKATREVDPSKYHHIDPCQHCRGEWTNGGQDLTLNRALADPDVTSLDELRDALDGETA